MVKALEELAEEEQKLIIQEEKEAAEKAEKQVKERKDTIGEVETPRSEGGDTKDEASDSSK